MNISPFLMTVKKEVWEFNKLLFWLPIIILILMIVAPVIQSILIEDYQLNSLMVFLESLQESMEAERMSRFFFTVTTAVFMPFMIVAILVQFYYFLACLYDERRDLSIYFWRSLPTSDALTIGAKLFTGALVIPVFFMLAATLATVIFLVFAALGAWILSTNFDISLWHLSTNVNALTNIFLVWFSLLPLVIWLFPVYTWLMLASVFSNKAPFLWAILPLVVVLLVESFVVTYFGLSSTFFMQILNDYFIIKTNNVHHSFAYSEAIQLMPIKTFLSKVSIIGILMGAFFVYVTYWFRVRKYAQA